MAISRAQLLKELLPGLNALFGLEYSRYGEEHKEIFETETSERSFEEETKLSGFSAAPVKNEGSAIAYDNAQEAYTSRYTHETIALGFAITEEANTPGVIQEEEASEIDIHRLDTDADAVKVISRRDILNVIVDKRLLKSDPVDAAVLASSRVDI